MHQDSRILDIIEWTSLVVENEVVVSGMSRVKVTQFVTDLAFRNEEIEVGEETTVQDLIRVLDKKYGGFEKNLIDPKSRELQYGVIVAINQVDVRGLQGLKTGIHDGDFVAFYPFISGG